MFGINKTMQNALLKQLTVFMQKNEVKSLVLTLTDNEEDPLQIKCYKTDIVEAYEQNIETLKKLTKHE